MAKYTIIADIGKGLINMLRDRLVPEPIDKSESIGICEPRERGGYIVGVHPYDIKEDASGQHQEKVALPDGSVQDPPAKVELYYMVSVCSKAELDTKAVDEARIIGKIIQIFKDNPTIPARYMPSSTNEPMENVPISPLPLNMEEKVKVWTMFGESYKLSVFYVVGPIAIDSEVIRKPRKRVETVLLDSSQKLPRKIVQFETRIKEEDIDDEYTEHKDEDEEEGDEDSDAGDEDSDAGDEDGDSGDEDGDLGDEDGDLGDEDSDAGDEDGDLGDEDGGDSGDLGDEDGDLGDGDGDAGGGDGDAGDGDGDLDGDDLGGDDLGDDDGSEEGDLGDDS
ncbi:MAG: DUF4255 domain-containing protein [Oscillospiraceae bacterium]|jgi:hypothetical protein|nr:DUF4255 domain-containing protein [Oscillospiraceae bacterium]